MALVVGGPVVIAVALRALSTFEMVNFGGSVNGRPFTLSGPGIFGLMIWAFYLRFTVPVLGGFYGTARIADEVEDKTITYLLTRPIARGAVLVGKANLDEFESVHGAEGAAELMGRRERTLEALERDLLRREIFAAVPAGMRMARDFQP